MLRHPHKLKIYLFFKRPAYLHLHMQRMYLPFFLLHKILLKPLPVYTTSDRCGQRFGKVVSDLWATLCITVFYGVKYLLFGEIKYGQNAFECDINVWPLLVFFYHRVIKIIFISRMTLWQCFFFSLSSLHSQGCESCVSDGQAFIARGYCVINIT